MRVDVPELARMIEREEDHLTVEEVAGMLMDGNHRLRVIDLRDSASYAEYHIPTAERMGISHIVDERFSSADTTVLYSDGGAHSAQVWALLAARGQRNVYTLRGGLNEWKDRILFPRTGPSMHGEEKKKLSRRTKFFGGELLNGLTRGKKSPVAKKPDEQVKQFQKEKEKIREVC